MKWLHDLVWAAVAAIALFAATVLLIGAVSSCTPSAIAVQARIANETALAANAALPLLVRAYTDEGMAAIEAAPTEASALNALAVVRERWRPVWGVDQDGRPCHGVPADGGGPLCRDGAWQALSAAEDAWAIALERQLAGQPLDLATAGALAERLRVAYCALDRALPVQAARPRGPRDLLCPQTDGGLDAR